MYINKQGEVIFFEPFDKQLEVIQAWDDPNVFYIVVDAGRQSGKTKVAQNLAPKACLDESDITVMWVSPSDNQAKKVYQEIADAFNGSKGIIKSKKAAKGDTEIIFENGSQILFRSSRSENTLRGNTVHYLILDEAAFMKKDTVEEILMPMQNVVGRKLLAISTPKGKNFFYDWFLKGQSTYQWSSFRWTCYDSPYVQTRVIEGAREAMTDLKFRQEYLAEFVDNASVFKNIEDCSTVTMLDYPIAGQSYYAGVDIGLSTDASVLTIIDGFGNMVKYYKWNEPQAQDVIDNIIEINRIWKFKKILFETNNHGMPMYQSLKKTLTNIQDFNTSTKTKPQIINALIHLFDTRQIAVVKDEDLRTELEAFNYKVSDSGNVKFGAASGFHDDMVMSLAIARYCYDKGRYNSKFIGFF